MICGLNDIDEKDFDSNNVLKFKNMLMIILWSYRNSSINLFPLFQPQAAGSTDSSSTSRERLNSPSSPDADSSADKKLTVPLSRIQFGKLY